MKKGTCINVVRKLQKENQGKVVLIRNGIFLCGIGKDAVIMNKLLNYKPICLKSGICKTGIPVNCFKREIPKLVETGYSFVVYNYDKNRDKIYEIYRIEQEEIYEEKENIGCKECWYCENRVKSPEEYIKELKNLMEKETNESV